jgi:peptidoglycan/xylan/chitin deacetylase (PgdA/CDA1 family)
LPLVFLGGLALLLGVGLGVAASTMQPTPGILSFLNGGPSPSDAASNGDTALPTAVSGGSAAPSGADGGSGASSGVVGPSSSRAPSSAGASITPGSASGDYGPSMGPGASPAGTPKTGIGAQAKPVYNGSRANRVVALTFDDGYNPVALRQILAILKREHITATFFPYGWAVDKDPAGWHMVVAAGYPIGNHTLTHAILTSKTPDEVTTELTRGRRTIDLYSGGKSVNLMRPPGGAFNAPTARAIAKAGYSMIVLWDVDTFDWQGPSADTIYQRAIKGTNGSIVLMHSGPLNTPKALPRIIASYRARGFQFVTVPQLLGTG